MKCPVCTTENLVMSERQGIEIDYCPSCRGIWLDRGELDKIIERGIANERNSNPVAPQQNPQYSNDHKPYDKQHYKHHKKHWLSDLFD